VSQSSVPCEVVAWWENILLSRDHVSAILTKSSSSHSSALLTLPNGQERGIAVKKRGVKRLHLRFIEGDAESISPVKRRRSSMRDLGLQGLERIDPQAVCRGRCVLEW